MPTTLASLLADYTPPQERDLSGISLLRRIKLEAKPEPVPEVRPDPVDHQAELVRRAEEKVRREEKELAQRRLDEALATQKTRFEEELNAQRITWVEQEGARISSQLTETFSNLERTLSDKVAVILSSFVSEGLRNQAIADLEAALSVLLSSASSKLMKVTGPQDILSVIEGRLGPRGGAIEFIPNDDVEVKVISQETAIETQIGSWLVRLNDALRAG